MNPSYPLVAAFGRLLLATIFLLSGLGKLADASGTISYIASAGLPLPQVGYAVALVVEIGGGLMLLAGFQTRWVAIVLAVFTVVAGLAFHRAFGDQNQMIHFLKNMAIAGGLLQVMAFGPGSFSIDARRSGAMT